MNRTGFVALSLLAGTVAASAALPPYWQRKAEIDAITGSVDVGNALKQTPIDLIEHVGDDHYRVKAGGCTLDVLVVDDKSAAPIAGPRKFKLQIGKPTCK